MKIIEISDEDQANSSAILYYRGSVEDVSITPSFFDFPEYPVFDRTHASPIAILTAPAKPAAKQPWERETWRHRRASARG